MKVRETPGLQRKIEDVLAARRRRAAALGTAIVLRGVMDNTPVEDGHAHEAWLESSKQATRKLAPHGAIVERATSDNERFASGDPTATAAGSATVAHIGRDTTIRLGNDLGFVRTLEYGGMIEPIAPGGVKPNPVHRPGQQGPLYGPRLPVGIGMVFYRDASGAPRFARSRTVSAGHFVGHAVNSAVNDLRRMGAKVKKL